MKRIILISFITLLLLLVLSNCAAPTSVPEPISAEGSVMHEPLISPNKNMLEEMDFRISEKGYFIEDQLILTGLKEDVSIIAQELGIEFESAPSVTFESLEGIDRRFQTPYDGNIEKLEILLVKSNGDMFELMEAVCQLSQSMHIDQQLSAPVLVDPNYVTGRPPIIVDGHPHSVGAHPFGSTGNSQLADHFKTQWAFTDVNGIVLYDSILLSRVVTQTGEGAHVLVFDTSPFEQDGAKQFVEGPNNKNFNVSHPVAINYQNPPADAIQMADHGLFALGLAYGVAPDADLELIRVLNDHGQGDLFRLIDALELAIAQHRVGSSELENVVLNMSLGIHPETDQALGGGTLTACQELDGYMSELGYPSLSPEALKPIHSLETTLNIADGLDAVIVAAAGNASGDLDATAVPPKMMELPAAFSNVIGVAASNISGQRSCFSNNGEVAAPGGDGKSPTCDPSVISDTLECNGPGCPYGVISLVLTSSTVPEEYGFAYWMGTSFAAPLVSGLAAIGLSSGTPPVELKNRLRSEACPSSIPDNQPDHDSLGVGIVNVRRTLFGDTSSCPVVP